MVRHLKDQKISAFERNDIAVAHDLHPVIPREIDAVKARERPSGQRHRLFAHIDQIEIPVIGRVVKMMVRVDDARHVMPDQISAVFPDIPCAVSAVDQDGIPVIALQQIGIVSVRKNAPGFRTDLHRPEIRLAHRDAHAFFIFQQNAAFAGKIKRSDFAHGSSSSFCETGGNVFSRPSCDYRISLFSSRARQQEIKWFGRISSSC